MKKMSSKEFIADLRERARARILRLDEDYWIKLQEDMNVFLKSKPTKEEHDHFYTTVRWDKVCMIVDGIRVEHEKQKKSKNKENKEVSE